MWHGETSSFANGTNSPHATCVGVDSVPLHRVPLHSVPLYRARLYGDAATEDSQWGRRRNDGEWVRKR